MATRKSLGEKVGAIYLQYTGGQLILHVPLPDGERTVNVTGLEGAIVAVTSKEELVKDLQLLNKIEGLEVFPEGGVLLLVYPLPQE